VAQAADAEHRNEIRGASPSYLDHLVGGHAGAGQGRGVERVAPYSSARGTASRGRRRSSRTCRRHSRATAWRRDRPARRRSRRRPARPRCRRRRTRSTRGYSRAAAAEYPSTDRMCG
jgi:hypothetical protein